MIEYPSPQKTAGMRAGFTLIELLVVISIIAILISVTIPIYKMVQDGGNAARSLANLKSIGTGLSVYAAENNNLLPAIESEESLDWTSATIDINEEDIAKLPFWVRAVINNAADSDTDLSRKVFNCPGLRWKDDAGKKMASDDILLAYGATDAMVGFDEEGDLAPTEARSLPTIEEKPNTILVIETKQEGSSPTSFPHVAWDDAERDFSRSKPAEAKMVDFRFKKTLNCLMADMSARGFRFKDKRDLEQPNWTGEDYESIR